MPADLIIYNATILTMQDNPNETHTALAVTGNRLFRVGTDREVLCLAGYETRKIDAQGATLMPGFYESHMHIFEGGASLDRLNLAEIKSIKQLDQTVKAFAEQRPEHELLTGYAANYTMLGEDIRPTRQHLDSILKDRPLYIIATDFHTAWANTCALEKAGILRGKELDGESEIMLDENGLATGELREFKAMELVSKLNSKGGREGLGLSGDEPDTPTQDQIEEDLEILKQGLAYCARHGITKIINMDGNAYQMDLLRRLELVGNLPCRIEMPLTITPTNKEDTVRKAHELAQIYQSEKLALRRVKLFMDGVYDSWTAFVVGDYPDRPGFSGTPLFDQQSFDEICVEADNLGLQICVHAVGDGAVRSVIDGYEAAYQANGKQDSRHRIEHIDTIHQEDISRLADLNIIASMQPVHPPGSAGLPLQPTLSLMGQDRWATAFAWKALADKVIPIAFGTDWPVSPLNPLYAIRCALIRQPWEDHLPDQRLTLEQCLINYTRSGAYAAFDEEKMGQIVEGMLADLVLIKGDLATLADPDAELPEVILTVCDGEITYEALKTSGNLKTESA